MTRCIRLTINRRIRWYVGNWFTATYFLGCSGQVAVCGCNPAGPCACQIESCCLGQVGRQANLERQPGRDRSCRGAGRRRHAASPANRILPPCGRAGATVRSLVCPSTRTYTGCCDRDCVGIRTPRDRFGCQLRVGCAPSRRCAGGSSTAGARLGEGSGPSRLPLRYLKQLTH
jgi:hypothetical protein